MPRSYRHAEDFSKLNRTAQSFNAEALTHEDVAEDHASGAANLARGQRGCGTNWPRRDRSPCAFPGDPRVLLDQIAVRHPRDVIADRAMQTFLLHPPGCDFAELIGICDITFEHFF